MALRQILIERPSAQGTQRPVCLRVSVDDRAEIGPWVTTLAARLGYPLLDPFGAPLTYRLRAGAGGPLLPMTGSLARAPFPSDGRFLLEPVGPRALPAPPLPAAPRSSGSSAQAPQAIRAASPAVPAPSTSRRALLRAGVLTTFSLLGLGGGMTTAFAQHLLSRRPAGSRAATAAPPVPPAPSVSPVPSPLAVSQRTLFRQHQRPVRALTWAPDGTMLASGGDDARVFIWTVDGALVHQIRFPAPIRALAWSPDGSQLAVGVEQTVAFFDAHTRTLLSQPRAFHTAPVTALGWASAQDGQASPQGVPQSVPPLAVSAARDRHAIVWNAVSHEPQRLFRQHTAAIEALSIQGESVATASAGGVVRVWQVRNGQEVHGSYAPSRQPLRAVALSATGMLACGGDDGRLFLWEEGRTCTRQIPDTFGRHCLDDATVLAGQAGALLALAFAPDGAILATGESRAGRGTGETGAKKYVVTFWSVSPVLPSTPLLVLPQQEPLSALAWAPSGQVLATTQGSAVALWQLQRAGRGGYP